MSMPAIDIEKLAPDERLHLIEDLWESLRVRPETVAITPAQRDELDRRLDELDGGDAKTITWADAKHRLRRR
jgi:putative addiction module component (TIGR02574 family)